MDYQSITCIKEYKRNLDKLLSDLTIANEKAVKKTRISPSQINSLIYFNIIDFKPESIFEIGPEVKSVKLLNLKDLKKQNYHIISIDYDTLNMLMNRKLYWKAVEYLISMYRVPNQYNPLLPVFMKSFTLR